MSMHRAEVVSVPAIGWADIVVPKLYRDSVIREVQSTVDVSEGDRVIVADLAEKAHVSDWWIVGFESEVGRLFPPATHGHSQGDIDGLPERLKAIEDRITALGG